MHYAILNEIASHSHHYPGRWYVFAFDSQEQRDDIVFDWSGLCDTAKAVEEKDLGRYAKKGREDIRDDNVAAGYMVEYYNPDLENFQWVNVPSTKDELQ